MNIFINGNSLKAFTSGTPQRGLIKALCLLRSDDKFTVFVSMDAEALQLSDYWNSLRNINNVNIVSNLSSQRNINIKKLFGIKNYQSWPKGFDFYLSPGMPEYFNKKQQPSISTVADLSSINAPETSSLKWHGNRIFKNTLKWCMKSNSMIGAISNFTRDELIEKYPAQKELFFSLHNGIEDFWFDDKYETNELTNNYKTQNYWVWWGFGSNRKNLGRLLEAYSELKTENHPLPQLLLIGEIAANQLPVKDQINNSTCVELVPFQEALSLKELVRNSKGLLFPSLYEGFGLPIIETYSQGRPVLYGNCTSMPEVASEYGIPVDSLDVKSIKTGLLKMSQFEISKEYEELVKKYASQFTYQNAAQQLSKLIDQLSTQ
ncbi:glycosyltransferase family 1 protein [Carboxylicivirga sp. M1479]|uniref:glycosyltransferase family 4 protein n=1 Tax=Carboxylicivirga sp. M1479 TaxID=2594476 RepID=UPI0011782A37|nr:glycosyltransferase family 1 protein [Carboxylicivirga sp. M1479]TRX70554.1 glycosyltransferase family 4 protein [Carboxylicivirga sp. M1479]